MCSFMVYETNDCHSRLVDENEKDVPVGQPGEALLKGPMITKGYHNNPEADKTAFTADGWFRTGDILKMENNLPYIVDRKKVCLSYKSGEAHKVQFTTNIH